jgi:hypothetical protein
MDYISGRIPDTKNYQILKIAGYPAYLKRKAWYGTSPFKKIFGFLVYLKTFEFKIRPDIRPASNIRYPAFRCVEFPAKSVSGASMKKKTWHR